MDVRAIVLVGPAPEASHVTGPGHIAGVPLPLLDVLGKPVLHRALERLRKFRVDEVTVICEAPDGPAAQFSSLAAHPGVRWISAARGEMWRRAEHVFADFVQAGAELVIAVRLGPYAEIAWDDIVQFHLDQRARVTSACRDGSEFGVYVMSSSRRNDAAFLFRNRFTRCRVPCTQYDFAGYFNPLLGAADLRRLATDAFLGHADIAPAGREIKPGVWAAKGARIHRGARVLAPAFIGALARVRTAAVITRCSSVEHHAVVDCGTVVEDASLLPFSYLGAGLDLSHAVVGFRHLLHLRRNVEVEIADPKLLDMKSMYAPVRALASAASLAGFLPTQIFRGFFGRSHRQKPSALPDSVSAPSAALPSPAIPDAGGSPAEFPSNLAVARRYGNE